MASISDRSSSSSAASASTNSRLPDIIIRIARIFSRSSVPMARISSCSSARLRWAVGIPEFTQFGLDFFPSFLEAFFVIGEECFDHGELFVGHQQHVVHQSEITTEEIGLGAPAGQSAEHASCATVAAIATCFASLTAFSLSPRRPSAPRPRCPRCPRSPRSPRNPGRSPRGSS